jgi:hypothetical protein
MKIETQLVENDKVKNYFDFTFEQGKRKGESYKGLLHVPCDNPVCRCCDLVITAFPAEDKSEIEYNFAVDLNKKILSKKYNEDFTAADLDFAKLFIKELTPEVWTEFNYYLHACKARLTEICKIDELDVIFPDDTERGISVGYLEIFPYGKNFVIKNNKYDCVIDDQYCLNPLCGCTSSILTFIIVQDDKVIDRKKHPAVLFDYKKNSYKIEETGCCDSEEINRLVDELNKQNIGLKEILKKRHQILRRLYSNFKKKKNAEIFPDKKIAAGSDLKTGRNDPCPCGSGKKYKKCCGQ